MRDKQLICVIHVIEIAEYFTNFGNNEHNIPKSTSVELIIKLMKLPDN